MVAPRSPKPAAIHAALFGRGESSTIELERAERALRWPAVGDESGDGWSARIEWCRLVHARENSAPRDRRGSRDAGDAYGLGASNKGDAGTRAAGLTVVMPPAPDCGASWPGTWRNRGVASGVGRRGVDGAGLAMVWSSWAVRTRSRILGEGDSCGAESESERALFSGLEGM